MTNAEKYLKNNVSAEEFVKAVWGSCYNIPEADGDKNYKNCMMYGATIERWLKEQAIPTLTEDERVILEFIANFDYIGRNEKGLYYKLQDADIKEKTAVIYTPTTNLFQFIKERRRI